MIKIAPLMGRYFFIPFSVILLAFLGIGCTSRDKSEEPLFRNIADSSGISFSNDLHFTAELNPYTFRNFFNGGGVAIADINNDGLSDIYFSGNQTGNKLYLNLGGMKFKDITEEAGVGCSGVWSTGVSFADVNADGWTDLYVCKSGPPGGDNRHNQLFINNGNLTFTDRSKEFGLDVTGLSVHAGFFDYDRDGDLDCYLLTNSIKSIGNFDLIPDQRNIPDPNNSGNKLFRNDSGKFTDVTTQAGIYHSAIGYGLGITFGDFNEDNWPDVFISNDFFERDYLYLNNQNGTFTESLTSYFPSISMGSMGADFADIDNDGTGELFVTEMLPEQLDRRKTKTVFQTWNQFLLQEEAGYHRQFSRNVLQKKIGHGRYAEIGRLTGMAATEWSWSALICDLDNDGLKDVFVANGIFKDLLDRDYLNYTSRDIDLQAMRNNPEEEITKLVGSMPVSEFSNYAFHNDGELKFSNRSKEWGLASPSYSCGSAYGDLDNDGDLDMVVNNINAKAGLFINTTDSAVNRNLSIDLTGHIGNRNAIGATADIWAAGQQQRADHFTTRGFQSSVQPGIRFGVGAAKVVDSLRITWPDGTTSLYKNLATNKRYQLDINSAPKEARNIIRPQTDLPFKLIPAGKTDFIHAGNQINDFDRDRMLPMMYSTESPKLIQGDIDKDGIDELYVTGGKNQNGAFLSFTKPDGTFIEPSRRLNNMPALPEETAGLFFDADGDGDKDFYLGTGGRAFPTSSSALEDRIFLNDGNGNFNASTFIVPLSINPVTSIVLDFDFDRDGDNDLFIGERFHPFRYGTGGGGHILINQGNGNFEEITDQLCKDLKSVGMITDGVKADVDSDGWTDLVLCGDWMDVLVIKNNSGKSFSISALDQTNQNNGWWNTIETADLNKDGHPDFILGNHGQNTFFKNGDRLYLEDFDGNGSLDQFFTTAVNSDYFPIADRDEVISQIPSLKKNLLFYRDFSKMPISGIFPDKKIKYLEVNELSSILFISNGEKFTKVKLPLQAQFAPIYALHVSDMDGDGVEDVLAAGNLFKVKPEFGRYDASEGWFFRGQLKDGNFSLNSGISLGIQGQVRDIKKISHLGKTYLVFAKHEDQIEILEVRK